MNEQSNNISPLCKSTEDDDFYIYIKIFRRPIYEFIGWTVWFFTAIFFLQNAIASFYENETRAAILYLAVFIVMVIFGLVIFIVRRMMMIEYLEVRREFHTTVDDKDLA